MECTAVNCNVHWGASELRAEESHHHPVKFSMESGAIKVGRVLADPRDRFGQCFATGRKKRKVASLCYVVGVRGRRQSIADDVAVPRIRRLSVLLGAPELHRNFHVTQAATYEGKTDCRRRNGGCFDMRVMNPTSGSRFNWCM